VKRQGDKARTREKPAWNLPFRVDRGLYLILSKRFLLESLKKLDSRKEASDFGAGSRGEAVCFFWVLSMVAKAYTAS